jgi:hypothetical protein
MVDVKGKTTNTEAVNEARVLAPSLPVSRATVKQLRERVQSTVRAQNQLAAIRADALQELNRRQGAKKTEEILREKALLPRRRARSEVETAVELSELPKTAEGLRNGEISHDNARIIAGASQRGNIDEEELAEIAKTQSPDKFAGTVRKHEQERSNDDGMSQLEHQRSQRFAKITTDRDDGMTVLYGRFDPITGAAIESVLSRKMNELWHEEDPLNRSTPGQRMADALTMLLTPQPDGKGGHSSVVRLLVIADHDVIAGKLQDAHLPDGTPIPTGALRQLACDAEVLPAIFRGRSQPLDLGRLRRRANGAQRDVLFARDGQCVGCGASAAWCQAHHIVHWMDGGPTNLDNLVLLCSRCHHKVHDDGYEVTKSPAGKYSLRPPPGSVKKRLAQRTRKRRYGARQRK